MRNVCIIVLWLLMNTGMCVHAQTRLGLHVTQEELTIWRQRSVSGPYRIAGDVSTNSPGDWTRIAGFAVTNAQSFLNAPTADRWSADDLTPASGCITGPGGVGPDARMGIHTSLLDAAFYILVNPTYVNRQTLAANVRTELLYEAGRPNLNFSNRTRWCNASQTDQNPFFPIAFWLTRLLYTYDYLLIADALGITSPAILSTGDKTTLDAWFYNAGLFWRDVIKNTTTTWFTDGNAVAADALPVGLFDTSACNTAINVGNGNTPAYVDGANNPSPTVYNMHLQWNNRKMDWNEFVGTAGAFFRNHSNPTYAADALTMIARSKQYFKEWIAYSVFANGTPTEFSRWLSTNPDLGWAYTTGTVGSALNMADVQARAGDTDVYNFSTTKTLVGGSGCLVTNTTTKTLRSVVTAMMNYVDHTTLRYIPGHAGAANYSIDSQDQIANEFRVNDIYFTAANLYWNDAYIKNMYMRTGPTSPPAYPVNPVPTAAPPNNFTAWGGANGLIPGVLFMFGQMEGVVAPYIARLSSPTNFRKTVP